MKLRLRIAAAALVVTAALAAGASGASAPRWIVVSPANADHQDSMVLSAGRIWFLRRTSTGGYTFRSARRAGGRLVDWKRTSPALPRGDWLHLGGEGRDAVFSTQAGTAGAPVLAVRLLPNGLLGDPVPLGGDAPPTSSTGGSVVQLRDRPIRLARLSASGNEFSSVLAVCCDAAGRLVGLGSLPASVNALALLGLDRGGRLWLAWVSFRGGPRAQARMVELDPVGLKPRGAPRTAPGYRGFVKIKALVCTETCRLVLEGRTGRTIAPASWAPGESAATPIRLPRRVKCRGFSCGGVIDARDDGGRLAVAYWADQTERGHTIGTARGDSRGRSLRRVASVHEPARLGSFARGLFLNSVPHGALSADGFAARAFYSAGSGPRFQLRLVMLPIR